MHRSTFRCDPPDRVAPTVTPPASPPPVPAGRVETVVDRLVREAVITALGESMVRYGGRAARGHTPDQFFALAGHALVLTPTFHAAVWNGDGRTPKNLELLASIGAYYDSVRGHLNSLLAVGERVFAPRPNEIAEHLLEAYRKVYAQVAEKSDQLSAQTVMSTIAFVQSVASWPVFAANVSRHLEQVSGLAWLSKTDHYEPWLVPWRSRLNQMFDAHYPQDNPGEQVDLQLSAGTRRQGVLLDALGSSEGMATYFKVCADVYDLEIRSNFGIPGSPVKGADVVNLVDMTAGAIVRSDLSAAWTGEEPPDIAAMLQSRSNDLTRGRVKLVSFVRLLPLCEEGTRPSFISQAIANWPFFAQVDRLIHLDPKPQDPRKLLTSAVGAANLLCRKGSEGLTFLTHEMQKMQSSAALDAVLEIAHAREFYERDELAIVVEFTGKRSLSPIASSIVLELAADPEVAKCDVREAMVFLSKNVPSATTKVAAKSVLPAILDRLDPWFASGAEDQRRIPSWAAGFRKALVGRGDSAARRGLSNVEIVRNGDPIAQLCEAVYAAGPDVNAIAAFLGRCSDGEALRFLGKMWVASGDLTDGPATLIASLLAPAKGPLHAELNDILEKRVGSARAACERLLEKSR